MKDDANNHYQASDLNSSFYRLKEETMRSFHCTCCSVLSCLNLIFFLPGGSDTICEDYNHLKFTSR